MSPIGIDGSKIFTFGPKDGPASGAADATLGPVIDAAAATSATPASNQRGAIAAPTFQTVL
jgi:hypothetical protein